MKTIRVLAMIGLIGCLAESVFGSGWLRGYCITVAILCIAAYVVSSILQQ